jgi:hypothetical protein
LNCTDCTPLHLPWLPIRRTFIEEDRRGYKVEVGDKIKIGRQILKLLEVVAKKPTENLLFSFAYVIFGEEDSKKIS